MDSFRETLSTEEKHMLSRLQAQWDAWKSPVEQNLRDHQKMIQERHEKVQVNIACQFKEFQVQRPFFD